MEKDLSSNIFCIFIQIVSAEPKIGGLLGDGGLVSGTGLGGGLLGGGGATSVIAEGSGVTGGLVDGSGTLLDVGSILGLKDTKCLKKCPLQIADTKLKCIKTTTFPKVPVCYGQNTNLKFIWPCQEQTTDKGDKGDKD